MAVRAWFGVALVALLLASMLPAGTAVGQDSESWTVMVYMSGDSSLADQMPQDLREMKEVGSGDGLEVLVLLDSSGMDDSRLLRVLQDGEEGIPLTDVNPAWGSELNMGDPVVLADFVRWAATSYPADRYMLDLWGHGSGWPGVCPDKGNYLDTVEVGEAMASVKAAGIGIDLISMDACQMGSLEMAYELKGLAGYALLSQKDVPLSGWPYDEFLGILKNEGTVEEKGAAMVDAYVEWGTVHSLYSVTLSLIDLEKVAAMAGPFRAYSSELAAMAGYFNPQFIDARDSTEEYDGDSQYDLVHLVGNMEARTGCRYLETLSWPILDTMDAAVVYERHWTNALDEPAENAHGLSIWFPRHSADVNYLATKFANDTGWPGFLGEMPQYFQQTGRNEVIYNTSADPADTDNDGLLDSIELAYGPTGTGFCSMTVWGPVHASLTGSSSDYEGNQTFSLERVGFYQVEFLLFDQDKNLVNQTLYEDGLAKEALMSISGRVESENGKGLRWVNVDLLDSSGGLIASAVSDSNGRYSLDVIVPTQTDGTGLVLVCGLGADRVNATIAELSASVVQDFTIGTGGEYSMWLLWTAVALDAVAMVLIAAWADATRRRRAAVQQPPGENVIEQQTIPPQ